MSRPKGLTTAQLLRDMEDLGVSLSLTPEGCIRYEVPNDVDEDMVVSMIRWHKNNIVSRLQNYLPLPKPEPPQWIPVDNGWVRQGHEEDVKAMDGIQTSKWRMDDE